MDDAAIKVDHVSKTFRTQDNGLRAFDRLRRNKRKRERHPITAVDNVSFTVAVGEIVALLGRNGAGKSSLMKMLTGVMRPTAGTIHVAGLSPQTNRADYVQKIGAVFGHRTQLWWDLPAFDSLRILKEIHGIPGPEFRQRIKEFDEVLELSSFWSNRTRHLSLGQRVRLDVAAALIHNPDILFLDEPTIGMDVVAKEQLRNFLSHQAGQLGKTILLTTHDMTEVDRLTERLLLLDQGRLVYDGSSEEIRSRLGKSWLIQAKIAPKNKIPVINGVKLDVGAGNVATIRPVEGEVVTLEEALRQLLSGCVVENLHVDTDQLEDVMRKIYRGDLGKDASQSGPSNLL